jgi:hypothetical protein
MVDFLRHFGKDVPQELNRLPKNACFVSGHDFGRAVKAAAYEGFSPWAFSLSLGVKTPCIA